ncbi:MAG: phosphotransferase [Beijerinckiaceae bacterium]|nr:phosphotransferase [Beijerinckiaceae bacterium]
MSLSPPNLAASTAPSLPFNASDLAAWLETHVEGFRGPMTIRPFEGGQSNPTYHLNTPLRQYVLRTKPAAAAKLVPSAHAIEREFGVLRALSASDVPVPRVECLCVDETVIGRVFYIMEFIEGRILWDPSLPGLTGPDRERHYDEINRVLAAIHTVDIQTHGLNEFGKPADYFERQIRRWTRQYKASADGASDLSQPIPDMEKLAEWLPENIPPIAVAYRPSVVHGDFRLDNLLFHPTEPRILAVLDWELSTLGHPLADLSYYCLAWHVPKDMFRGMSDVPLAAGVPTEAEFIKRWCVRTDFASPAALRGSWNFFLAFSLFRVAAILQGISKRVELGTAGNEHAAEVSVNARPLSALGWGLATSA